MEGNPDRRTNDKIQNLNFRKLTVSNLFLMSYSHQFVGRRGLYDRIADQAFRIVGTKKLFQRRRPKTVSDHGDPFVITAKVLHMSLKPPESQILIEQGQVSYRVMEENHKENKSIHSFTGFMITYRDKRRPHKAS